MNDSPSATRPAAMLEDLAKVNGELRRQLGEVQEKLDEADATLDAIRRGEVDAFVMGGARDTQVFTVELAERYYLQLAQEVANVGTWDFDPGRQSLAVSDGMRVILGVPEESEILADDWWQFIHPLDRDHIREIVAQVFKSDHNEFGHQFRLQRPNGETRWLSVRGRLLRGLTGEAERFIGIGIDVTEQHQMQESLRDADRRKDEFLAVLAHELRNPLFPIMAAGELLKMEPDNAEQAGHLAVGILRQSSQLQRLIDDLLDVARINSGKLRVNRSPMLLHDAVVTAVETSRPQVNAAGVTLTVSLTPEDLPVDGDAVRLTQVMANMLTNAAKFTPSGGRVEVMVSSEPGFAVICIRDSGIGIPAEQLEEIFGLFSQVDSSNTREQGGLGIGLTLARNLVELHGGTIAASSPGRNLGSEFTIRLPLIDSALIPIPAAPVLNDVLPSFRCLVVDDNRAARLLLGRLLEKLGQTVRVEADVKGALAALPEYRPEVIISDIAMPGLSGHDLARQVRSQCLEPQPTLIALTGYAQEVDRVAALDAGFDQHLQKPISFDGLRALVSRLVAPTAR